MSAHLHVVDELSKLGAERKKLLILQYSGASQGGSTTLRLACANGHLPVVQWLIDEKHMDFRAEKDSVRSPTRLVVSFEDEPESVSATCCRAAALQSGATVLLDACAHGHLSVVQWLIEEKGVDHHMERDNVRLMRHFHSRQCEFGCGLRSVECRRICIAARVLRAGTRHCCWQASVVIFQWCSG